MHGIRTPIPSANKRLKKGTISKYFISGPDRHFIDIINMEMLLMCCTLRDIYMLSRVNKELGEMLSPRIRSVRVALEMAGAMTEDLHAASRILSKYRAWNCVNMNFFIETLVNIRGEIRIPIEYYDCMQAEIAYRCGQSLINRSVQILINAKLTEGTLKLVE
jgi:hypothetical protein